MLSNRRFFSRLYNKKNKKIKKVKKRERNNPEEINQLLYKIKNHLVNKNISLNPNIYIKYFPDSIIIEDPNFYTSQDTIKDNKLLLRSFSFTGLRGALSYNDSEKIIYNKNKKDILQFLSIFSGRLFRIKTENIFRYIPQGYMNDFLTELKGYNYDDVFKKYQIISKHKRLENLIYILNKVLPHIYIKLLSNYRWIKVNNNQNTLANILLGNKMIVKSLDVYLYFNNYTEILEKKNILENLHSLLSIYSDFYTIKYKIPKKSKILLGHYLLENYY